VIGKKWEEALLAKKGNDDYIPLEIKFGIEQGLNIIPILVGRDKMPYEKELPEEIKLLSRKEAFTIRSGKDFKNDIMELIKHLLINWSLPNKNIVLVENDVILLLKYVSAFCKPLIWMRDTDSCLRITRTLLVPLSNAIKTILRYPKSVDAFCDKMKMIYERAITEPWVGIGAQPISSRLGKRTTGFGLMKALEFASEMKKEFIFKADTVKINWKPNNLDSLFSLTQDFIDYLDWREFVIENPRGQATCLLLEAIELLTAVKENKDEIYNEVGDVFYNLMACCLCLNIREKDIFSSSE
jgi:hypothetical protein